MLGFCFIFVLVASYPLYISCLIPVECVNQQEQECDQTLLPRVFPTTLDQLRNTCRDVQELGSCTLEVFERCVTGDDDINGFRLIANYIRDICREESEVFQVISSNLQCIASNIQNMYQSCNTLTFSEPTKEVITSVRRHANRTQEETGRPNYWCLETLWRAYCPSTKAGISCGFEVGAAVKDILLKTSGFEDPGLCAPEYLAEVTPMLGAIVSAIIEEENLKEMEENEGKPPAEEARRKRRFALFF